MITILLHFRYNCFLSFKKEKRSYLYDGAKFDNKKSVYPFDDKL